jgi:hypothetical protein
MSDIAVCLALRNPTGKLAKRCIDSFKRNAFGPTPLFFTNSDPAEGAAEPLEKAIQQAYRESDANLFVVAADDLECVTYGWDEILRAYRRIYPGARVFSGDEGRKSGELLCHPVFTREWIDALGYAVPSVTKHYYSDTWVERVAKLAGRYHYCPSLRFRHWVGASGDQEYIARKMTLMERDRQAYLKGVQRQEDDANKLAATPRPK